MSDDLYMLLVTRGYAQHEAHRIAYGPPCLDGSSPEPRDQRDVEIVREFVRNTQHYEPRDPKGPRWSDAWSACARLAMAPEPAVGHGWTCVTERLPTEDELKAGVLFGIHWPEGRIEMVSWDMEYQHDYDLMCRHFEVFQPDRSQGTGYWRTSASIAPPRSPTTKAGDA